MNQSIQYRYIKLAQPNADLRTVEASLSSETPVEQWDGFEILDHSPGSVDLSRAKDGLPLLFSHNPSMPVGIIENIRLEGRKLRGTLRFGESYKAEEVWRDVLSGILRNLSIGYRVKKYISAGKDTIRVTSWEVLEASIVTIPADQTVGVGRSFNPKEKNMSTQQFKNAAPDFSFDEPTEEQRVSEIKAMCRKCEIPDHAESVMINTGMKLDDCRKMALGFGAAAYKIREQSYKSNMSDWQISHGVGLTDREARNFSITRAINAVCTGDWRGAGFERECSDTISKRIGKPSQGFFVPVETLKTRVGYASSAPETGGALVSTNLLAGSFVDMLRNKTRVIQMGAMVLSGLVGNVDIPRRSGGHTAYWLSENEAITESDGATDSLSLTPKTIGALTRYSRNMLLQSTPDIEGLIRSDLASVLALGIDLAVISGTGLNNQPKGIIHQSGIHTVVGGATGAAVTMDHLIDLAGAVEIANAVQSTSGFLLNGATVKALSKLKSTTGEYLWNRGTAASSSASISGTPDADGTFDILGYRATVSNQLPSNGTKSTGSNLSTAIFGTWGDVIIGEWSVLEILANPYGDGFTKGAVHIRALQTIDVGIRHPESFAVITDLITA